MPADLRGPLGITFLAVKSQDTEAALDVIAPLAGPDTVLVSLQNGMNPPRIAARLGAERTVAAFVSFPADWQEPGHIEHGGKGNIWIGELDGRMTPRLATIQKLIAHAVGAHVTDNILGYLWAKQIDCSLLFAQAVTDLTFAETYENTRYQPLLIALVGEGVGVALTAGVRLQAFDAFDPLKMRPTTPAEVDEARAVLDRFADFSRPRVKVRSGPWRDLAVRKRPTEVDHMVGWVVAEGKTPASPCPSTRPSSSRSRRSSRASARAACTTSTSSRPSARRSTGAASARAEVSDIAAAPDHLRRRRLQRGSARSAVTPIPSEQRRSHRGSHPTSAFQPAASRARRLTVEAADSLLTYVCAAPWTTVLAAQRGAQRPA